MKSDSFCKLSCKPFKNLLTVRWLNTNTFNNACRNYPISSCGAKYLVRLANHLADVHQLVHIQRRQYLQEAKLQPKVKVVFYESEEDNSGKNHYRNPVQTRETVNEL